MQTFQMIHKGKIWFPLFICVQFATLSYSQRPDVNETIMYLNRKLSPNCIVKEKHGDIIATYFDKDGKKTREDRISIGLLDTIVRYDKNSKMFIIPALNGCETCVTRKVFTQKSKRKYSRMTFFMDGSEADKIGLRKALIHLIRINSEFRYHDEITFEE